MASKLAYLSKYTLSENIKAGKKSKKKKANKEKKDKDHARVHNVDDGLFGKQPGPPANSDEENEDEEEDWPIVVPSEELPAAPGQLSSISHRPIGSWKVEGADDEGNDGNQTNQNSNHNDNDNKVETGEHIRDKHRRRRGDSGSNESAEKKLHSNRERSDSLLPPRRRERRRYDSDSDNSNRDAKVHRRLRHDSPDDNRSSKTKKEVEDSDFEKADEIKRTRNDSSDEDIKPEPSNIEPGRRRRRYDSDSDSHYDRKQKARHESLDDHNANKIKSQGQRSGSRESERRDQGTKQHYDASSSDAGVSRSKKAERFRKEEYDNEKTRRRKRHESESDDQSGGRKPRQRHDSDSDVDSSSRKRGRVKKDESDSGNSHHSHPQRWRRRYDSDDDDASGRLQQRRFHDSSLEKSADDVRARMSSGHAAGLQRADEFTKSESILQQNKQKEAQAMVDKYGMGDTVYRDAEGRKTDVPPDGKPKRIQMDPDEQRHLNQSRLQRANSAAQLAEIERLQKSSFARYADDDWLEDERRNEIRADDPMAAYAQKKMAKKARHLSAPLRPVYKGPPAKPNRFGIFPGYRWDGVDRGNGFEDKLLAQRYNKAEKEEQAYHWRSADM